MDQNITITPHLNGLEFPAAIFFPKIRTQSTADAITSSRKLASRRCFFTPRNCVGKITASSMTETKKPKKLQRKRFISGATSGKDRIQIGRHRRRRSTLATFSLSCRYVEWHWVFFFRLVTRLLKQWPLRLISRNQRVASQKKCWRARAAVGFLEKI
jgi:hypothetical protein